MLSRASEMSLLFNQSRASIFPKLTSKPSSKAVVVIRLGVQVFSFEIRDEPAADFRARAVATTKWAFMTDV